MHGDFFTARNSILWQFVNNSDGGPCQAKTNYAAEQAQQPALNKELPHQPQLARAQRRAHGKFLLAAQATGN